MDYPISLPQYPNLDLRLRMGGIFSGPQILKDGISLKKKKAKVQVPLPDGSSLELTIKSGFDMTPKVEHAGVDLGVVPPLPLGWTIWAYCPMALIFLGGAIGGFCGAIAAGGTLMALRSELPRPLRILSALLLPPLGLVAYTLLATLALKAIH